MGDLSSRWGSRVLKCLAQGLKVRFPHVQAYFIDNVSDFSTSSSNLGRFPHLGMCIEYISTCSPRVWTSQCHGSVKMFAILHPIDYVLKFVSEVYLTLEEDDICQWIGYRELPENVDPSSR